MDTVEYKNITFRVWDIGGRTKITSLWQHYYRDTQAIIFVVDSNDKERLSDIGQEKSYFSDDTACEELHRLCLEDELKDVPILIMANKQDLPFALSIKEVTERLRLKQIKNRKWHIQSCCARTGDGLYEGLDWLSEVLNDKK